ncbi:MAG: phage tail length tape measure family protein, partial [Roseovarius sp.]|nr:phage tail length tape measure family protein [Roseovarius sp.]
MAGGNDERVNLLISALVDGLENVASLTGQLKELEGEGKKQIPDNTKDMREGADETAGSMESLRANIGKVVAVGASLGVLAKFMKSSADASMEADTRFRTLEQAIKTTGRESDITAKQIREMSRELALGTLASTEEVEKGAAALMTFRNVGTDSMQQVLELSQDLAQSGFGSLESNAKQLGKALEDPAQGMSQLSRAGITFTKEQQKVIKSLQETGREAEAQAMILATVSEQVGGVGRAAAEGLEGTLDTLQQRWTELKEAQGDAIEPALTAFYEQLTEVLVWVTENLDSIHAAAKSAGLVLLSMGSAKILMALTGVVAQLGAIATTAGVATGATRGLALALRALPFVAIASAIGLAGYALYDWAKASREAAEASELQAKADAELAKRLEEIRNATGVMIYSMDDLNRAMERGAIVADEATGEWLSAAQAQDRLAEATRQAAAEQERLNLEQSKAASSGNQQAIYNLVDATKRWADSLTEVDHTAKGAQSEIRDLIAAADLADRIEMAGLLAALDEIKQDVPELAALIEKELVGAIQKLDSQQLATLQASLRQAYENGTISAEQFAERSAAVVESAAKQMGISLKEALGELTPATEKALRNLDTMMDGMKAMGKTTEEQGKAAEEALSKAFSGAKTKADLDAIIADVKRLGDEGTLTAEQIKDLEKTYTESMRKMAVETSGLTAAEKELAAAFDARYAALKQQEAQAQQSRLAQAKLNSETARTSQALDEASTSADEAAVSIDVVGKACRRAGRDMNDLADGADAVAQAYRDTMNAVLDTMNGPMNPIEFSRFYARAMKEAEFAASEKAAAIANLNDRLRANEQANNNAARGVQALEMRLLELTA